MIYGGRGEDMCTIIYQTNCTQYKCKSILGAIINPLNAYLISIHDYFIRPPSNQFPPYYGVMR